MGFPFNFIFNDICDIIIGVYCTACCEFSLNKIDILQFSNNFPCAHVPIVKSHNAFYNWLWCHEQNVNSMTDTWGPFY